MSNLLYQYQRHYLRLSDSKSPLRRLYLLPLSATTLKKYQHQFIILTEAFIKLGQHIVEHQPQLLPSFGLSHLNLPALKKRHPQSWFQYARIDTILTQNGFKVLELNARRPQMYEDTDWFNLALSRPHPPLLTSQLIVKSIFDSYRLNHPHPPQTIVLFSNFTKPGFPFSFISLLKNEPHKLFVFSKTNINLFYRHLHQTKNILYYKKHKIDLIIDQMLGGSGSCLWNRGQFCHPDLENAYSHQNLEISSSPFTHLIGSKLCLSLIQNPQIQSKLNLTASQLDAIKTIPLTFQPKDFFQSHHHPQDFLIKKIKTGQGLGVFPASQSSRPVPFSIIQQKVTPSPQPVTPLSSSPPFSIINPAKSVLAMATLEPFLINQPQTGKIILTSYSSRAIPIDNYTPASRFNPAKNRPEIWFGLPLSSFVL